MTLAEAIAAVQKSQQALAKEDSGKATTAAAVVAAAEALEAAKSDDAAEADKVTAAVSTANADLDALIQTATALKASRA